jgi:hypothetical protein
VARVARWYVFKPKISIWVNFGGPWNGKGWHTVWPFGIYYGHLVYFMAIGIFFPVLVNCVKNNLATLSVATKIKIKFCW